MTSAESLTGLAIVTTAAGIASFLAAVVPDDWAISRTIIGVICGVGLLVAAWRTHKKRADKSSA